LKKIISFIKNNIWLKISGFNSLSVLSRIFSAWIINKLIAIYIGPQGTGITEQFKNFLQGVQAVSALGIQEGVTKFTAEYQTDKKQLNQFINSSIKSILIFSFIIGLSVVLLASEINHFLFPAKDFTRLIIWTGILLPFIALNLIFLSILKGFQAYKQIVFINSTTHIVSAMLAIWLIIEYTIYGALYLVLFTQIITFFISSYILFYKVFNFKESHRLKLLKYIKLLSPYILMALITALIVPFFSILIRNHIFHFFEKDGTVQAGFWDATKKISNLYLSLITPVFTMYYYPQMAKIKSSFELKREIQKFIKQILPVFTLGILFIYFFRSFLINLFFSPEYQPMESLFIWQLLGDYLKILSFLIAYLMLAKAHYKLYIFSEIGFWVLYYLLTLVLMKQFALKGVVMAYFISYVFYLFFLGINYYKYFKQKNILIE